MTRSRLALQLLLMLSVLLTTATAFAAREVSIERLDGIAIQQLDLGPGSRGDCVAGNLNAPVYAITDYVYGAEKYAHSYGWFPGDNDCDCPLGWQVEMVHILLQFGAEDVPATFDVQATARTGRGFSMPPLCPWPTDFIYGDSGVYSVTIDTPGLYDIGLPMISECAWVGYEYTVVFDFLDAFDPAMRPDLITDDFGDGFCLSFVEIPGYPPWEIPQVVGLPGEIVIYADMACCEFPIDAESATWGSLKALYR